ncbi:RNA-binding 25 [Chlorella sorokiniana]|uniref:RNA-binding 25 n=1 Tax=Chlorella sorokiniana TaxID=3076 RepID=A0A2P6TV37_CHLSO|nr:RNA-binding 25 [Chlorella sorokiniana]|eukprot:PRW57929.1 RNA-binding 25 [Chlorella sorokiniana]
MAEAANGAGAAGAGPSGGELFTRGGPNVPDNRGQSMVAKHLEKQQKEKEARAMERLHLLLPALGPTVRAVALQQCNWDEERALTMLRRFQVAKVDELSKLHKERRKHQLALQTGRPEKRRSGKERDGKRKRRKGSGSDSGSGSGSGSESSGSESSSGGESESESEEERGRRKGGKRRRSRSRSRSKERSGKRGRKEKRSSKDKKRGSKEKKKKREKEKKAKKERREKDKAKAKAGAIGQEYGKYGIIRETDMYSKRPEFQLWAIEVKNVDIEAMPRSEEKEMFKDFMEEYNTATLPHKKYYDLELHEKQQAAKAAKKGSRADADEGPEHFAFNDEEERKREIAAERARRQQERLKQAYQELQTTDKAKDMREQQLLRSQMELAYKTGDRKTAEKLAALLAPTDLADLSKPVRPPASGT